MTIAIDVRCLMDKNYSGVAWYGYYLLKNLFARDKNNQYLLFYNSSRRPKLPEFNYPNVHYRGFSWPNKLFNLSLEVLNRPQLDKLLGGVDIFFAPNLNFLALSDDCRKIITVHDLSFLHFKEFFTLKSRLWHWLILRKKILSRADVIIADSNNTKNDLINLFALPMEKIKVIYLGVEKNLNAISEENLIRVKEKYHLPEKFILFLGALEPRKNLAGVIKTFIALNNLNDYQLIIGGTGDWRQGEIFNLTKNNQRIKFLGYVNEADKPALYQLAKVFVYPSYYEGFGLPLLEAMTYGCPVICGSNSSQTEVVGLAGLLVNPYNMSEIKQAIEGIIFDDDFRQQLIAKGLERSKMFSWQKTAQETLDVFNGFKK